MKQNVGYAKFATLLGKLVTVPHSEIKAKLDAEKKAKKNRKKLKGEKQS